MLADNFISSNPCFEQASSLENNGGGNNKRKRRPAGTPDPDAEVVSLSPKTLLESDRYVCEICNQGFQRDQNLQMHRRRHKVPWKLLKRDSPVVKKRVFVCPEPSCLHHDPCHALGDLVGIKKHFRRKHSNHKQWVCDKCAKGYAVQSDFKAHLKTCGTRGHSCDCGRVFSRVESFIEHQDTCNMGRDHHPHTHQSQSTVVQPPAACLSRTASSRSPSHCTDTNFTTGPWASPVVIPRPVSRDIFLMSPTVNKKHYNLDLQLSTASNRRDIVSVLSPKRDDHSHSSTQLKLSICSSEKNESKREDSKIEKHESAAREQLSVAMAEKAYAEEARIRARRQIELAEQEFANAKKIRQQAQAELDKAQALREHAMKQINSTILQVTCHACKHQFQTRTPSDDNSLVLSYMSSALTEGEVDNDTGIIDHQLANTSHKF
ncbi:zinc finger protein SHOOT GRAVITROPISM 5-like [Mercurialis annua]|uniref:zinc finger protein SHOOT GRAVITROPISM 5-like n=1 Tax=Mercurialis annua TaxID=3986 RepID=UPI00215F9AA5|nr:zinc finger protein SHOOT GRAVITROPISM 5-like [Mercurialis annua]